MEKKIDGNKEYIDAFCKLYENAIKMSECDLETLRLQISFIEDSIKKHYEEEPNKLFKKKHKSWEEKLRELDSKIFKLYQDLEVVLDDHYKLIENKKENVC